MNKKTVILANGEFPGSPRTLRALDSGERIICCDGAIRSMAASGRKPFRIIGDLDSFPAEFAEKYRDILIHEAEQETNDLAKAFRFCIRNGWTDLLILGGTGKREDHTLGNISYLADFAKDAPGIQMMTENGIFFPVTESGTFPCEPGIQLSIFSFDPVLPVTSEGLKYKLDHLVLPRWWRASLNETLSDHFSLDFPGPGVLILFLAFPEQHF